MGVHSFDRKIATKLDQIGYLQTKLSTCRSTHSYASIQCTQDLHEITTNTIAALQ